MANSIVRFDGTDGIEILIDTTTGESFASIRGYARMSGKALSTIHERLQTVRLEEAKTAEIQTVSGAKTVRLITEDLICQWIPQDNPAAAASLLKMGVRMALHKMAGYEVVSTATQPIEPPSEFARTVRLVLDARAAGVEPLELWELHQSIATPEPESPAAKTKKTKLKPKVQGASRAFLWLPDILKDIRENAIVPGEYKSVDFTAKYKRSLYERYVKWSTNRGEQPIGYQGFCCVLSMEGSDPRFVPHEINLPRLYRVV